MCLPLLLLVLLIGPGMLLAAALTSLADHGAPGVLAGVLLVALLVTAVRRLARAGLAWWRRLGSAPPPTPPTGSGPAPAARPSVAAPLPDVPCPPVASPVRARSTPGADRHDPTTSGEERQ